ncbi:transcriptional repressor [archaeon]|nr:transcriptional repressor [archaeon]
MDTNQRIVDALRKQGYKATPQRIAIAQTVLRSKNHPSAETIHAEVLRLHPTVSLSTVYNTLHILRDMNFLNELTLNGTTRYDPNVSLHINMICQHCGKVIDVEDPSLEESITNIAKKRGFKITGQRVDVYGVCKLCQKHEPCSAL